MNRGGSSGFGSWNAVLPLVAVIVVLPFWWWEKRAADPIVDPTLLIDRFRAAHTPPPFWSPWPKALSR
ncbi:hypothetical protein NY08_5 [Rhodococcus sp. B7740]|uniref:hypothetical protein n=1 Tax=Rhodococcus sp. B7740 TaxID=1564114 RepID=UPI0005D94894|nr:hypothetical protein [Rhodococcus sp. B7740]AJW38038.1 hypothetical protein NY08_5 [Rhodococcus sp. B7740]